MAHIVELREMSDEQLEERLENAREEMFNLRFQKASAALEDTSRIRTVRREVAQLKEVLHKRQLAIEAAARQPEIATVLDGSKWNANARYDYERSGFEVTFFDGAGNEIATAMVDLNQKRRKKQSQLVRNYEVTG